MKRVIISIVLLTALAASGSETVIRRGAALPQDAKAISIAMLLEAPERYTEKPVLVEGVIEMACTNKGCWMQLASDAGKSGVRVTFKDYGFFIPLDSKGMRAR